MKNLTFIVLCKLFVFISCGLKTDKHINDPNNGILQETDVKVNNYLNGSEWRTKQLLCLEETVELYEFTMIDTTLKYNYGNFVKFTDSTNFVSFYTAPCGNDCFTSVYGKYHFTAKTEMCFNVDSVTYNGECYQPTKYRERNEIVFIITKNTTSNSIKLTLKDNY